MEEKGVAPEDVVSCTSEGEVVFILGELITHRGSVNCKSMNGKTVLHYAVSSQKDWIVEFLLSSYEVAVNSQDNYGETPLICAAKVGSLRIVNLLHKYGAEVDLYDSNKDSALLWAAYYDRLAIVVYLVEEMGADPNHSYIDEKNALLWAIHRNSVECADYLFYKTHTVNVADKNGRNVRTLSKNGAMLELVDLKIERQNMQLGALFLKERTHGNPLLEGGLIGMIKGYATF